MELESVSIVSDWGDEILLMLLKEWDIELLLRGVCWFDRSCIVNRLLFLL